MVIVIGLGNTGEKYARNRHNVGFMVVDAIVSKCKAKKVKRKVKFNSSIIDVRIAGEEVFLVKPQTFMNKSGEAVRSVVDYYAEQLGFSTSGDPLRETPDVYDARLESSLFIVHDELDFLLGRLKIQRNGGSAGHNGVQSVIDHLGTKDFVRFRVGVQAPHCDITTARKAKDYLLSDFTRDEWETMESVIERTAEAVVYCVENGVEKGMNEYNG